MLEEAVAALKGGDLGETQEQWSPQISLGTSVLIPESYVGDLQLRLGLYRRLSTLEKRTDIDGFAAELVDRFGELPEEVKHLLDVVEIKGLAARPACNRSTPAPRARSSPSARTSSPTRKGSSLFMQKSRGGVKHAARPQARVQRRLGPARGPPARRRAPWCASSPTLPPQPRRRRRLGRRQRCPQHKTAGDKGYGSGLFAVDPPYGSPA